MNRNALSRTERLLAGIRLRVRSATDGELATRARADLRRLTAALDAVIELHARRVDGTCRSCPPGRWRRQRNGWPCATLRTMARSFDDSEATE